MKKTGLFNISSNNWKLIIIGVVTVFLMSSGVLNFFQDKWNQNIKDANEVLKKEKDEYKASLKALDSIAKASSLRISMLEKRYDSIKLKYDLISAENRFLEKDLKKEKEKIKETPPSEVYSTLNELNPDTINKKEYPFSGVQIKRFYVTYLDKKYYADMNSNLEEQIDLLFSGMLVKDAVIKNSNLQIGSLKSTLTTSQSYITTLEKSNKQINKAYRTERLMKNVFIGTASLEFLIILYQALSK